MYVVMPALDIRPRAFPSVAKAPPMLPVMADPAPPLQQFLSSVHLFVPVFTDAIEYVPATIFVPPVTVTRLPTSPLATVYPVSVMTEGVALVAVAVIVELSIATCGVVDWL